ncbi:hypothetical protein [Croceibacter atlanticus]|jgi:hypothetical protein|uniref:hypothetical protein n=1 Tax=Croceibacter atlanticus TaxID=313588 RepID=UPI0024B920C3|nr:hypothetical protein [Croceibacter atlanticus]
MDTETILLIAGFAFAFIIIICSYYFSKRNVVLRQLTKVKSTSLVSVRHNQKVKVFGKVKAGTDVLTAPLSKRKCVYYYVEVKEKNGNNGSRTIFKEERIKNFMIEANGAFAVIKPQSNLKTVTSYVVQDISHSTGFLNDASPRLRHFIRTRDIGATTLFGFNKNLEYKESSIEIGERIAVLATAKWKKLNTPIEGYNYSSILELEGTQDDKLIITDDPVAFKDKL